MAEFNGTPRGSGRRVVVVASRFNETITRPLVDGALEALVAHEVAFDDIDVVWVPGAWELPLAARRALESGRYDALVALGAVIRGETPHFDFVAGEASRGLALVCIDAGIPVGFGLLTCDTMDQALARAGGVHGNKGWDAAVAALETTDVLDQIEPADEG
ncbi:MAG TPA: 6,7-dimethyl-8-ribityllumazine synthase [Gemmatimonadaceae bacterium]|jgi:6,7-dimethyl-8-ribityllumazine synthase|nr:6,7-dimethyl-8-ribityllumazine synthase [Gemmatimonadaceae bacterium]